MADPKQGKSLAKMLAHGRKFGCESYSVKASVIKGVDSEGGHVVVTARSNNTGKLVLNELLTTHEATTTGIPLPGLADIAAESSEI